MMRTTALIRRIAQQLLRDKRTLALLFVAPLLILSLMYFIFSGEATSPHVGLQNGTTQLQTALHHAGLDVTSVTEANQATMNKHELDAIISLVDGKMKLLLDNSDPSVSKQIQMRLGQLSSNVATPPTKIEISYVYGSADSTFFDTFSPVLIGYFVFFFVFLIAGIGLLRERTTGTLERLMSTPIRRREVIIGYLFGYGIFAVIQTIIVVLYSTYVLDIPIVGSIWLVLLVSLLVAFVALSLGILLSTFASNEFQMIQFIPLVIVPQIFFAGIFSLDGVASWLQSIGKIMPIYYSSHALRGVMYKGFTWSDIQFDLLMLVLFAFVFIVLNVIALKKYRKS